MASKKGDGGWVPVAALKIEIRVVLPFTVGRKWLGNKRQCSGLVAIGVPIDNL